MSADRFGRVAVLMGGLSAEREVSLVSGAAVLKGLQATGVDAHGVDAGTDVLQQLQQGGFDRVFIVLHGRGGEDGLIQGALQTMGIPYTGSGVLACALAMDKMRTKHLWRSLGLPTADWRTVSSEQELRQAVMELGLPVMVKPNREGSSIGMTRVDSEEQIAQAWAQAGELDRDVLVEQWIHGQEYTAAVIDGKVYPLIRLETPRGFYDYQAKYVNDDTLYHCPCGLPAEDERRFAELALKAYQAVSASGWGRVDFFVDQQGNMQLLEVNLVPGMTSHSLVPMAAAAAGMDFNALVVKILESSLVERD